MRTLTFTSGRITATVASRTRRTSIIEAKYRQVLATAFPEIVQYEQAMYALTPPRRPDNDDPTLEERYNAAYQEYVAKVTSIRAKYPVGSAYADRLGSFYTSLSRLKDITGAIFSIGRDGLITDKEFLKACDDYLNGDLDEDADDDFWSVLGKAIRELDKPLRPAAEKPPQDLTNEEREDPLSEPPEQLSNDE